MFYFHLFVGKCDSQMMANVRSLSSFYRIPLEILDIDSDKSDNLVEKFKIKSSPTLVVLKFGKESSRVEGFKSIEALKNDLGDILLDEELYEDFR